VNGETAQRTKGRKIQSTSCFIFIADHLSSHHKEGNELPFDDFCSPQFWGIEIGVWSMCKTDTRINEIIN